MGGDSPSGAVGRGHPRGCWRPLQSSLGGSMMTPAALIPEYTQAAEKRSQLAAGFGLCGGAASVLGGGELSSLALCHHCSASIRVSPPQTAGCGHLLGSDAPSRPAGAIILTRRGPMAPQPRSRSSAHPRCREGLRTTKPGRATTECADNRGYLSCGKPCGSAANLVRLAVQIQAPRHCWPLAGRL